jgi:rhodanese-related sulfurtransferase
MKKNIIKKCLVLSIIVLMLGLIFGSAVNAIKVQYRSEYDLLYEKMSDGYTNLTVEEAWDLLTDTANGIQIPIDVRTNNEWINVHMDTPVPENPRHYCLALLQDETMLQQFMTLYDGLEVIIYCAAGYRSFIATNILIDNGFTGTIYNMPGGMSGWLDASLPTVSGGHTNITVEEALELFTNLNNGIQIPIDVRTDGEWADEHIDTPFPENPIHHPDLHHSNETQLQEFNALYNGREIILYCAAGYRSFIATNLLIDNEFNGTIYNMLGGISAWKAAGYPTRGNQQPDKPTINGPPSGKPGEEYSYTFVATDPDSDELFYCVNWSDDTGEIVVGPYESSKEIILNHSWDEKGNYIIKAKAIDRYGNESDWATFEVTMPRNRATYNSLFLRFLEQFPILQKILGYIL